MKPLRLLTIAFTTTIALISAITCNRTPSMPEASVSATQSKNRLDVRITVPDHHHAYLDSGREKNLLPVIFDWKSWLGHGLSGVPEPVSAPLGESDRDTGAMVLRGQGVFSFELPAGTQKGPGFRVRVQICDEVKGICYRPSWHEVKPDG